MLDMLKMAAESAMPRAPNDTRHFWLGCIGFRRDGTQVESQNAAVYCSSPNIHQPIASAHAEGRLLRKLGKNAPTMFVARVSKQDHSLVMAQPCPMCQVLIKAAKVQRVYFTINATQYGLWIPARDEYRIISIRKFDKKK